MGTGTGRRGLTESHFLHKIERIDASLKRMPQADKLLAYLCVYQRRRGAKLTAFRTLVQNSLFNVNAIK